MPTYNELVTPEELIAAGYTLAGRYAKLQVAAQAKKAEAPGTLAIIRPTGRTIGSGKSAGPECEVWVGNPLNAPAEKTHGQAMAEKHAAERAIYKATVSAPPTRGYGWSTGTKALLGGSIVVGAVIIGLVIKAIASRKGKRKPRKHRRN